EFLPPKPDLVYPSPDDYVDVNKSISEFEVEKPIVESNEPKTIRKENRASIVEDWVSGSEEEDDPKFQTAKPNFTKIEFVKPKTNRKPVEQIRPITNRTTSKNSKINQKFNIVRATHVNTARPKVNTVSPKAVLNAVQRNHGNPQQYLKDKGVIDSGCSRHMTGNKSYLTNYIEIDGGFIAFRCNSKGGKTIGKGKIRTDHLGKFDRKADEGFFVGYSTNSKSFKVFNSKTRIVEENLHVKFSKNTPNIAGSGPNWIFDIYVLTKSMSYKPVIVGNQSNGSIGIKTCDNVGKTIVETVPDKDYILLPLWTQEPLFSFSSKDSPGAGYKPSGEEEKKDAKDPGNEDSEIPSTEELRVDQEEKDSVNSTNRVNVVSSTVNTANNEVNVVGRKSSIELPDDPNMPDLGDISIFKDSN
nr:ribonuclease H-like domain-containing protein [Tanacetum cinerariifolium]